MDTAMAKVALVHAELCLRAIMVDNAATASTLPGAVRESLVDTYVDVRRALGQAEPTPEPAGPAPNHHYIDQAVI